MHKAANSFKSCGSSKNVQCPRIVAFELLLRLSELSKLYFMIFQLARTPGIWKLHGEVLPAREVHGEQEGGDRCMGPPEGLDDRPAGGCFKLVFYFNVIFQFRVAIHGVLHVEKNVTS